MASRSAIMARFQGGRLFPRVEFHDFERERRRLKKDAEDDADEDELPVEIVAVRIEVQKTRRKK